MLCRNGLRTGCLLAGLARRQGRPHGGAEVRVRSYERTISRSSICGTSAKKGAGVHSDCGDYAGARDWCKYSHLLGGEWCALAAACFQGSRSADAGLAYPSTEKLSGNYKVHGLSSKLP